jgi:uncharacterized protein YbjT (DUF2867 family)
MTQNTILVTGATGNIGRPLVALLKASGATLIAGSPSGAPVDGVPGRRLDFNDAASLDAAFAGIDTLFLLLPLVPNKLELARQAVNAAKAAGITHILRSSGAGADPGSPVAIAALQGRIDQLVIGSGLAYTLVRPNGFMQNYVNFYGGMIKAGTLYLSHGAASASFVDVRDIAAVDAAILRNPAAHAGKVYTLTGPQAVTHDEAMRMVSAAIGRPVRYVPVTEAAAVQSMKEMGMDDWTIAIMSSLNQVIAAGYAAGVSSDVQALTGRAPRTLAAFVAEQAGSWR